MFNPKARPTKIFLFGAKGPHENADLVDEQIRRDNRYKHTLIEIELKRRKAVDAKMTEIFPALAKAEQRIEAEEAALAELREQISAANAKARLRNYILYLRACFVRTASRKSQCALLAPISNHYDGPARGAIFLAATDF